MDLYTSLAGKYILLFLGILLQFFAAFAYAKFLFNKAVDLAIKKFIIPSLKTRGLEYCDFVLLPNQYFGPGKEKGDWEDVPITTLFNDTRYNRKLYGKLSYSNNNLEMRYTTVRISLNGNTQPVKIDFYPLI